MPQQPEVAGLVVDVDGTLLDTNYLHVTAWARALHEQGFDDVTMSEIHRAIGLPSDRLVRHLTGRDSQAASEAHSEYFAEIRDRAHALPEAGRLLRQCRDGGWTVVLVTSGAQDDLDWMLPLLDADDAIESITTSSDVGQGKPDPDPVQTTLERHGLDPSHTVSVGDSTWDILAARRAGIDCLAFTSGGIAEAELRDAGALEVYAGPADLLEQLGRSRLASARGAAS